MTTVLSPAGASANVMPVPVERATKTRGQGARFTPGSSILLDVQAVAELLGCSPRTVYRFSDAGRMPEKLKVGALARWSKPAIAEWIAAGCPSIRNTRRARR